MTDSLPTQYDPRSVEDRIYAMWIDENRFHAEPGGDGDTPYTIVIPPPNVTGALHLGHALNNTLQDILIRRHRMMGDVTLWMPGTDHAGIATQSVVERQVREEEGKSRYDLGREELVRRIWKWRELYGNRILEQLERMGCSCDWDRTRFTLDDTCARAVRHTFFRMFEAGYIYRGKRLVNWDPLSQTAISDDELEHETVRTSFWYIRYPLKDGSGHVTVATTRPETMLGDTAVAINPKDPRADDLLGKTVILPLMDREIPIIADDYVSLPGEGDMAEFSTGFLKVTPAHDPNDFEIGERHGLELVNIFNADATVNANGGKYEGLDRFEARKVVLTDLEALGLVEDEKPYQHEVAHSDRSKVPIEPWLSDQWFVNCDELAKRAAETVRDGRIRFVPERYADTYLTWLENLRDWCISRQLWWGHRIPIWQRDLELPADVKPTPCPDRGPDAQTCAALDRAVGGNWREFAAGGGIYHLRIEEHPEKPGFVRTYVCIRDKGAPLAERLEAAGWQQDEDVLDTWFSSALWPHSTMGWPEDTPELKFFYPTNVLVTSRDIITLWVARMVMTGLFNVGDVPFTDVYIHAKILDGKGETMSKSKGNGVDPLEIIEGYGADALRFSLAHMCTETQDVRMPVEKVKLEDGREVNTSKKFEIGRNFCNKLWNAARFVLGNLEGWSETKPLADAQLARDDRWILSRLAATVSGVNSSLEEYAFGAATQILQHFFWNDFCDCYVEECAKPNLGRSGNPRKTKQRVLTFVLDQVLRLLHPIVPYITEAVWEKLNAAAPSRDLTAEVKCPVSERLIVAQWPHALEQYRDSVLDEKMAMVRERQRAIRMGTRMKGWTPSDDGPVYIVLGDSSRKWIVEDYGDFLQQTTSATIIRTVSKPPERTSLATTVSGDGIYVEPKAENIEKERQRLRKQLGKVEKGLRTLDAKLANENFLAKADPEVVASETQRQAELQAEMTKLQASLADLEA